MHQWGGFITEYAKDPWDQKLVLSLDGGGVRGYCSLLILSELMQQIELREKALDARTTSSSESPYVDYDTTARSSYLPCHYFDYVGGASTGGIVAIMLGRLRASVQTTLEVYQCAWEETYHEHQHWLRQLFGVEEMKFKEKVSERMANSLPLPNIPSWDEDDNDFCSDSFRCRTIICALRTQERENGRTSYLFRSYRREKPPGPLERNSGQGESFQTWEVARLIFPVPAFRKNEQVFYDSGFSLSHPS